MTAPYRTGGPGGTRCIACGEERLPDARACPRCGVEAPAVRCVACMTLNAIGEAACTQCGAELAPEPEATPTSLICPRGCGPLAEIGDVRECEHCGGLFVANDVLARIVMDHKPKPGERRASITPPPVVLEEVTYRPCPTCNVRMNRTIFGKSSGVVVDVCKDHGTWFDARELTASLAFIERGGLALVEKREKERKAEAERAAEVERRTRGLDAISKPMSPRIFGGGEREAGVDAIRGLVDILLSL